MEYLYTVWFRDLNVDKDDPDHEWPACFIIRGKSSLTCKKWCDLLSKKYSEIIKNEESDLYGINTLPIIDEFDDNSYEKIGW